MEQAMRQAFCTSFVFYLKAAGFHWNVVGENFVQMHDLFGKVYGEVYDSIDGFAERMRILGSYAPGSLATIIENSAITETREILDCEEMVQVLLEDNDVVVQTLTNAFINVNNEGVKDFLASRIDAHGKHGWMLRVSREA